MILSSDTGFQPSDYFFLKAVKFLRRPLAPALISTIYYITCYPTLYISCFRKTVPQICIFPLFLLFKAVQMRGLQRTALSSLETPLASANTLPQSEEVADNVLGLQILRRSIQDLVIPVKEGKDCLVLKWYKVFSDRRLIRLALVRTSTQPQL